METIKALLDAAKKAKSIESDYALAKALNLPTQRISDYYSGKRTPDQYACKKIAESLAKPLDEVIAAVEIDGEKDEKRREEWRRYYKSIGGIAAGVLLCVTLIVTPTGAEAAPLLISGQVILCIMLSVYAASIIKRQFELRNVGPITHLGMLIV